MFKVEPRDGYEEYAKQSFIFKSYNYPYYDPVDYRESGGYLNWSNDNARYSYYDSSGTRPQTIN